MSQLEETKAIQCNMGSWKKKNDINGEMGKSK